MSTMPVAPAGLGGSPGLPKDGDSPVFAAPWQAQAFALAVALYEHGAFTWPEWAKALGDAIGRAQSAGDPDDGSTYYHHWLDALEQLIQAKGLGNGDQLDALAQAWADAADRTPHGRPIELNDAERALARRS